MKYIEKRDPVEARQFLDWDSVAELFQVPSENPVPSPELQCTMVFGENPSELYTITQGGASPIMLNVGNYVIQRSDYWLEVMTQQEFEAKYEPVNAVA